LTPHPRPRGRPVLSAACALVLAACAASDPQAELAVSDLETYWAVDPSAGGTQYLAPVVRFRLQNKAARARSIQATATFRRKGEAAAWSSAWQQVSPRPGSRPLAPGQTMVVTLKPEGEGRYSSTGAAESMFAHKDFKDVTAEVFLRVGSSAWAKFATSDVSRRLGSHRLEAAAP